MTFFRNRVREFVQDLREMRFALFAFLVISVVCAGVVILVSGSLWLGLIGAVLVFLGLFRFFSLLGAVTQAGAGQ